MELRTVYKNFKVRTMVMEINKLNTEIKVNNDSPFMMSSLAKPNNNNMVEFTLNITPFKRNEVQMTLPISTFISL